MACCSEFSSDSASQLLSEKSFKPKIVSQFEKYSNEDRVIKLKRGGIVVKTKVGNIQFGIPPETIKDAMALQLEVPRYFVIPHQRFDKKYGVNIAEFEFPAYFNFFIKQRKVCLIGSKEAEEAVRIVFIETLNGPQDHSRIKEDFISNYPEDKIPDFFTENSIFNPKGPIPLDSLVQFMTLDEQNPQLEIQEKDQKVVMKFQDGVYDIIENGIVIERIKDIVQLEQQQIQEMIADFDCRIDVQGVVPQINLLYSSEQIEDSTPLNNQLHQKSRSPSILLKNNNVWGEKGFHSYMADQSEVRKLNQGESFEPPEFGVTVLGASHGFDPNGSTSGLILWINGSGIMVDPPPFAMTYLKDRGISSILIKGIIISHCHADHDAGTFHKVLDHNKIEIITTKTIMRSFMKKYSALSRISPENLEQLFYYRPATIGASLNIYGAEFKFCYSLHTIPCLGFEVSLGGKTLYFSGDTFFEKNELKKAYEANKLKKGRYEEMAFRDFSKYDIIIHEAGIPPIHTPQSSFLEMDPTIQNKIFLYHIASKDIQTKNGLKGIKQGLENTLVLISRSEIPYLNEQMKLLDILSSIQLFDSLNGKCLKWLIDSMKVKYFDPDEILVREGEEGDSFFIIASGIVKIFSNAKGNEFERVIYPGAYFGEVALINNQKRAASVQAITNVKVYFLLKHDFNFIFGSGDQNKKSVINQFKSLAKARNSMIGSILAKNNVLSELSQQQQTQMEIILHESNYKKGENVWNQNDLIKNVCIIKSGLFELIEDKKENKELVCGMYVGETNKIIFNTNKEFGNIHSTSLRCLSQKGSVLTINKKDISSFLKDNPGLKLIFCDNIYFGGE